MNKKINRKGFLKIIGSICFGFLILPFEKLVKGTKKTNTPLKEAKYYSKADDLAG